MTDLSAAQCPEKLEDLPGSEADQNDHEHE
jgi:hypothetical protein